ncbi:MAG: hypothetical protein ACP59X_18175 [Solidesulfovibrio sp. DCME]|uniref:hypothetical protein n=1 Tax=Solidesulfovibrio sp. DCME TaxID=3447380 RepID=UPI003D11AB58
MSDKVATIGLDTKGIEAALARAVRRAEKIARETGTPLIFWKDGHIVEICPDQLSHQDSQTDVLPGIGS